MGLNDSSIKLHIKETLELSLLILSKGIRENLEKAIPIAHRTMVSAPILFTTSDLALARTLTIATT